LRQGAVEAVKRTRPRCRASVVLPVRRQAATVRRCRFRLLILLRLPFDSGNGAMQRRRGSPERRGLAVFVGRGSSSTQRGAVVYRPVTADRTTRADFDRFASVLYSSANRTRAHRRVRCGFQISESSCRSHNHAVDSPSALIPLHLRIVMKSPYIYICIYIYIYCIQLNTCNLPLRKEMDQQSSLILYQRSTLIVECTDSLLQYMRVLNTSNQVPGF